MSHPSFECIRSASILGKDGLPALASICVVPSMIDNALSVACAGFDSQVRLLQFHDDISASNTSSAMSLTTPSTTDDHPSQGVKPQQVDTIVIGRDNYPILSVSSVSQDLYTCVAFGGLSRQIHLVLRTASAFPNFYPLLSLDVPLPVSAIYLKSVSYNKREETNWNIRVFAASQDKSVHMYSVSITMSLDGTSVNASQFHHLRFVGHNSSVRAMAFNHSPTGEATHLLTGADDFALKVWPLNLLDSDKVTRCTTYEGHEDDILAIDCKSGWVVTGSKDKSVGFWDLNPAKTVRAEKSREVKIERVPLGSVVRSVLLSDDATMAFVGCGDGSLKTLARNTSSNEWSLTSSHTLHKAPIDSIAFTQNVLVTSSQDPDSTLAVWSIPR